MNVVSILYVIKTVLGVLYILLLLYEETLAVFGRNVLHEIYIYIHTRSLTVSETLATAVLSI